MRWQCGRLRKAAINVPSRAASSRINYFNVRHQTRVGHRVNGGWLKRRGMSAWLHFVSIWRGIWRCT